MEAHFRAKYPKSPDDSDGVYRSVIRAKALDTLRGLLPAATTSNVGLYGTGQAYEALILRMRAHPLAEVRGLRDLLLAELQQVIPAFLARVDQPDARRPLGPVFCATRAASTLRRPRTYAPMSSREPRDEVTLTEFDPEGEVKVVAVGAVRRADLPDDQLLGVARAHVGRRSRALSFAPTSAIGEPAPQAGARVRADALPVRRPRRLRRVPRSAAASAADAGVAAALPAARLRRPAAIEEAGALRTGTP